MCFVIFASFSSKVRMKSHEDNITCPFKTIIEVYAYDRATKLSRGYMYQSKQKSGRAAHLALAVIAFILDKKRGYLPWKDLMQRQYRFSRFSFITLGEHRGSIA